jgi:predicted nucleotide-binding protein (sugar kinase/HSP70/actin superfamily)
VDHTTTQKTIYIPNMCDHAYVLEAALKAFGLRAEVLPAPDDDSTRLGLDLVLGRECSPCMITVGDVIRLSQRADFDPAKAIVLMPTAPGPCRFGQYSVLQRHLLDEQGLREIEILNPNQASSYRDLGDKPTRLRLLIWEGIVAVDLLQQLLHRFRPYEIEPGSADVLYAEGLERVLAAVTQNKRVVDAVRWCGEAFAALAVEDSEPRPLIGLVGEIYVRFNDYTNQHLIRRIEKLGGEVLLSNMMEWMYFITWNPGYYGRLHGNYLTFLRFRLTEQYQRHRERVLARPVAHLLRSPYESPTREIKESVRPYLEPMVETEAVVTLGKAIELAHRGASGILAVMPFSCMPGIVSAAIAPRVRADLNSIPWLDLTFDLQRSTNIQTRLEAFMSQARYFQRRIELERGPSSADCLAWR